MLLERVNNFLIYLFVFSLPFTAFSVFSFGGKSVILSWFLISLLVVLNFQKFKKISEEVIILCVWIFILFLSVVSIGFSQGFISVKFFYQLLNAGIMMIHIPVLCLVIKDKNLKYVKKLINILLFSAFLSALYGFYQYLSFLNFLPQIDILRNADIYCIYKGVGIEGWSGTYRSYGFFPEPSFWACFLLIPMSFLAPYLFSFRKFWIEKFLFLMFLLSLFITFGRSGWVGFLLMILIFPFTAKINLKSKILYFTMALVLLLLFFGSCLSGYLKLPILSDLSFYQRFGAQAAAYEIFLERPLLGVGFGNFENFADDYFTYKEENISFLVAHNFYLRILAETGLIGFAFFLFFLCFLYKKINDAKRIVYKTKNESARKIVQGTELSFFSILFFWIFVACYNFSYIWFIFALIAILIKLLKKNYENSC